MYQIIFFVAIVMVILLAKKLVGHLPQIEQSYLKNRWLWGIFSMVSLAIGVLIVPNSLSGLKIPFIILAIFAAMVFFEMTRLSIEAAMAIHDAKNQEKMAQIQESKHVE